MRALHYIFFYVDGIILTGNNNIALHMLIIELVNSFKVKDMGLLSYFIGIQVDRLSVEIFLHQSKYILGLLQYNNMLRYKPCSSPCSIEKLCHLDSPPLNDPSLYRSIIGALQ